MGSFLLKDQKPRTDGSPVWTAAEGGEGIEGLRGEELFKRLNEHGTFAQVYIAHFVISAQSGWFLLETLVNMSSSTGHSCFIKSISVS